MVKAFFLICLRCSAELAWHIHHPSIERLWRVQLEPYAAISQKDAASRTQRQLQKSKVIDMLLAEGLDLWKDSKCGQDSLTDTLTLHAGFVEAIFRT